MSGAPWEELLAEHFPGYLLPEAYRRALPEDVAMHFLDRLEGHPRQLFLLRAASVIAARSDDICELALTRLPDLGRTRRTEIDRRTGMGELRGHLDVHATLRRRTAGRMHEIVARTHVPRRRAPEDVLLASVAARLVAILRELRDAGVIGRAGWGAALAPCEEALDDAIARLALEGAVRESITALHEHAARDASHPAYALALAIHVAIRRGIDTRDPTIVARSVAEGALAPLADHTRFELAVLVRLIQCLERLPGWTLRRTLVMTGRRDVAELEREDGARIRVHYDQAPLDPGPYDAGLRRYFDHRGRLRPDVTVVVEAPGRPERAVVVEAKLSEDPSYLVQGYREAIVYRAEYGDALTGWPKAILVTPARIAAPPHRDDDVVAIGWDTWVPPVVLEGLLESL